MDIDIGFWLTLIVLVSGVIWIADKALGITGGKKAEDGSSAPAASQGGASLLKDSVEFSNSLLPVFVVVLVVRSFIFEPFTIPSGSMLPTLKVHDFILVNKFAYGLRLPVTNTRITSGASPQRGDVMVFRYPVDPSQNYIKRVIGVPGDTIRLSGHQLYVNGQPISSRKLDTRVLEDMRSGAMVERNTLVEDLTGINHLIQHDLRINPFTGARLVPREEREWVVPEGSYFMLGDNRENSQDSRFWGFVPEQNIVGRASVIWMHWEGFASLPSFSRNGAIDKAEAMK